MDFYKKQKLEVESFESGFILKSKHSFDSKSLLVVLESVDEELQINILESNYGMFYKGVDDENDVITLKENLQKDGAAVRVYEAQRI